MNAGDLIGTIGVTVLLVAFALNLANRLSATSAAYLILNAVGAALTCVSSYLITFWPFVVLEGVWTVASLVMLFKTQRK